MADKRFADGGNMKQVSHWLQNHVVNYSNFGQASSSLTRFFKVGRSWVESVGMVGCGRVGCEGGTHFLLNYPL